MRSKKAFYNMISSVVYEIVLLISGLILPRIFIQAYGSSNNGLISSASHFLNYISFLTLGVAGPTRVALYKTLSMNDMDGTNAVLHATRNFYIKICKIFVIYIIILAFSFPFIVDSQLKWYEISLLVFIIAIGMLSEYFFGVTFHTLLVASQETYIYTIIKTINRMFSLLFSVILIQKGYSLFLVEFSISVFNAFPPLLLNFFVKRKYSIDFSVAPNNAVLKQRKDAAASSIANIVHDKTDVFLLTIFSSTALVSVYSVYMIVMNGLIQVMRVFTNTLEAPFGNMYAKGEYDIIRKNLRLYELLIYSFVAIVFSTTWIMVLPFITLYTQGVHDVEYVLPLFATLLTIATSMQCIRQPYLTMVQAAGKYKENKVGNYMEAALNVSISLILVHKYGLVGVTIGTLVANVFRTVLYAIYMSKNLINRSLKVVVRRFVWLLLTVGIIIALYNILHFEVKYDTWMEWVISGFCVVSGTILITFLMNIIAYSNDVRNMCGLIKRMLKR